MFLRNLPSASGGGGGAPSEIDINTPIVGGTVGSVLFIGAGTVLAQDNSNFFWDDTNDRLGIGTASPAAPLHVLLNDTSNNEGVALILTHNNTSGAGAANIGTALSLRAESSTGGTIVEVARIAGVLTTAAPASADGDLLFYTMLNGTVAEKWRITDDGFFLPYQNATVDIGENSTPLGVRNIYGASWELLYNGGSAILQCTDADNELQLRGNRNAASVTADVRIAATNARTAGYILRVENSSPNTTLFRIPFNGGGEFIQRASGGTAPWNLLKVTGTANTTDFTATSEMVDVYFSLNRQIEWDTGAITTQRSVVIDAPTFGFDGASTVTTATTLSVTAAPGCGTNATITTARGIASGGAQTYASVAGLNYAAYAVPAHTITLTGTTQVTAACGFAGMAIEQITITDGSAITVDAAASLYIAAAPTQGGSVTLTNGYALWVDAGATRLDGDVTVGGTLNVASVALTAASTEKLASVGTAQTVGFTVGVSTAAANGAQQYSSMLVVQGNGWKSNATAESQAVEYGWQTQTVQGLAAPSGFLKLYRRINAGSWASMYELSTAGNHEWKAAGTSTMNLDVNGNLTLTQLNTTASTNLLLVTAVANTNGNTASTEVIDVYFNLNRAAKWATGALATQRFVVVDAPSVTFVGASTLTTAVTVDITGAPTQGSNATITNAIAIRSGAAATQASAASATYRTFQVQAHTVTIGGTTNITSACYAAGVEIQQITLSNATIAVTAAASLYIANAPTISGGGTITSTYAIFVDAGIARFDGNGARVFELPADATGNVSAATGRIPVLIGGSTKYIRYYDD